MRIVKYFILLLFLLYGLNNFFFERVLFFNELLSLVGFSIFLKHCCKANLKIVLPKSYVIRLLLFFWVIFLVYALASIPFKTEWYYYFRHLSIFYSTF
ncbi:MAG: hypothetical protein NZ516_12465, partial [Raineya sp.]|nr:hypothetical protein [Raineya sp.]